MAMIEELHRQHVRHLLDAFYSGDVDAALSHCTDDIDFFCSAPVDILPHLGHHHGKADVRRMWETVHRRYCSMRYQMPVIVAEGEKVAVSIRAFFKKQSNKRTVQFDVAIFFEFRDGRIAKIREIIDTFDLVQQVVERDLCTLLADHALGRV